MEALVDGTRHAAPQQRRGTMPPAIRLITMTTPSLVFIQGITREGKAFRPSDWAERLAGAMSSFRPAGVGGIGAYIGYSPYCVPRVIDGVKGVLVDPALREVEPMAWDFVMNFGRDNNLVLVDMKKGSPSEP
jgi:hypothetical protein